MTHYETLGVDSSATLAQIKSAYRNLAKQYHPDSSTGDEDKFKVINEAYSVLSDDERRRNYDLSISGKRHQHDFFRYTTAEDIISDDFFNIFVNNTPYGRRAPLRNKNIHARIIVTLDSIVEEQEKFLSVNTGAESKTITVKIPAGIHNNALINFKGLGQNVVPNVPPGDLLVDIIVVSDPKFERVDNDLISDVEIDCLTAMVGGQFEFETLRKKKVAVTVPAGTQHNALLRLANEGLPAFKSKINGDQLIRILISIPTNLTDEQVLLIKKVQGFQSE